MDDEEVITFSGEEWGEDASEILDGELHSVEAAVVGQSVPEDLTESGSFDFRDAKEPSFFRLLRILPVPVLLVDRSLLIVFANRSLALDREDHRHIVGSSFSALFPRRSDQEKAASLLHEVFLKRKPMVAQGLVQIGSKKIWAKLHLRSVRTNEARFVLALVADSTEERKHLVLKQKYKKLINDYDGTRKIVEQDAKELEGANEALRVLIAGIDEQKKSAIKEIRDRLSMAIKPLLERLRTETLSSRAEDLVDSLAASLDNILAPTATKILGNRYPLTLREMRICELISSGLSSKEMASIMGVSPQTIFFHRSNIRKKLGLTGTSDDLGTYLRKKTWD
ncbi:MAG: LuxR C-terminal-related transcriptional regulator [Desulfomonilaceae bacterium]